MKTKKPTVQSNSANLMSDKEVESEYNKVLSVQIMAGDIDESEVDKLPISEKRNFLNGYFKIQKGVDLFETPELIPLEVQNILDEYEDAFMDGEYRGLSEALTRLEKIGYTFDYYLDGVAYDLRPIGMLGKCAVENDLLND